MPLFTRCNIGLGCPQNVFVKFQHKIPKIYYNHLKISFLGPVSKSITILNVNELHPHPAFGWRRHSHTCGSRSKQNNSEGPAVLNVIQPYMFESEYINSLWSDPDDEETPAE